MAKKQRTDPIDILIERIADAVVNKIDERQKIDAIAEAVLLKIQEGRGADTAVDQNLLPESASPIKDPDRSMGKKKAVRERGAKPDKKVTKKKKNVTSKKA